MLSFKTILKAATLIALCFSFTYSTGQLVTDGTIPPAQLVQGTLLGSGVQAFNITYTGSPTAIGFFDGENTNIGLDRGVIMTTGTVIDTTEFGARIGPHGPNDATGAGIDNNEPGDPDLTALDASGAGTFNAAVLEFDFIPTGDTLRFNYVFASEEYPEFAPPQGGINDVFGFFLSGPGIVGQQNIALIPGTTDPVSINNVNAITNQAFYIANGTGAAGEPQFTDSTAVQYDGFTTVLEAFAIVIPCTTYHIKLAISDVSDGVLDSGVFLEAESFGSGGVDINVSGATNLLFDSTIVEGCTGADFIFSRPPGGLADTIFYDISGSAINGVDYAQIPDSVIFLPNETEQIITLFPIDDGIVEQRDTVELTAFSVNACGDTIVSRGILYIIDSVTVLTETPDIEIFCPQDSVTIEVMATGGINPYVYQWNTGQTTPSFNIATPAMTDTFIVSVTDSCATFAVEDTVIVTISPPPPVGITVQPDTTLTCAGIATVLNSFPTGGVAPLNVTWNNGFFTGQDITVLPQTSLTYTATVVDGCGQTASASLDVTVALTPPTISVSNDTTVNCASDLVSLTATVLTGEPPFTYDWSNGDNTATTTFTAGSTNDYIVTVFDACNPNNPARDTVTVTVAPIPPTFTVSNDTAVACPGDPVTLTVTPNVGVAPFGYQWDTGETTTSITVNPTTTTVYVVGVTDACNAIPVEDSVFVVVPTPPALTSTISPDTTVQCAGDVAMLSASGVAGSGGPFTYSWSTTDATSDINVNPTGATTYTVTITDRCGATTTNSVNVDIESLPSVNVSATGETPVCVGTTADVSASVSGGTGGGYTIVWSGPGTVSNTNAGGITMLSPDASGIWTVTATDRCGNGGADQLVIDVIACDVTVPNVFTPNGDGLNDVWIIENIHQFPGSTVTVFNRWGKKVFEKTDYDNTWNGDDLSEGTYFYTIDLNNPNNENKSGTFNLMRAEK